MRAKTQRNTRPSARLANLRTARQDETRDGHHLIVQADIPARQREMGNYDVAIVANPYGEVIVRGEVRRHRAVRRVKHFELLYRRRIIDRATFVCLEWYDSIYDAASAGMYRSALDTSGKGGSGAHVPISYVSAQARSSLTWARTLIPEHTRAAFDAVMHDDESFAETARRECASRYVRRSLSRERKHLAMLFMVAAAALKDGVLPLLVRE